MLDIISHNKSLLDSTIAKQVSVLHIACFVLRVTGSVVSEQDRCSEAALHEEGSGETRPGQHAVSRHASDLRTAAALHPAAAQTLLRQQVCLHSTTELGTGVIHRIFKMIRYFLYGKGA